MSDFCSEKCFLSFFVQKIISRKNFNFEKSGKKSFSKFQKFYKIFFEIKILEKKSYFFTKKVW